MRSLLEAFGAKARSQLDDLFVHYTDRTREGDVCFVNQPGARKRIRPWCDAVEIAAMFEVPPPHFGRDRWIESLRSFQDPASGLVPEHIADDRAHDPAPPSDPARAPRYNTMIAQYALECLGASLPHPVANAAALSPKEIVAALNGLDWARSAWAAGDWVDCFASCLYVNQRHGENGAELASLFAWLDAHGDPGTGVWGDPDPGAGWLQPVNGFYRLTRGTYAQFGVPLPHPERAIDTILDHARDARHFPRGEGNACNVLDVVHPLWLCLRQTSHRRGEAEAWIAGRLPRVLERWVDGQGFAFDPANDAPSLQGTEMWLSIVFVMAEQLGWSSALGYRPRGVHRLEAVGRKPARPALPGRA